MMSHCLTLTSRKQRRTRRSVRWSLFLAAALCLPTGLAWAQGNGNQGNGNQGNGNQGNGNQGNGNQGNGNQGNGNYGNNGNQTSAPEIDPSVAVSALAILTGGILLVGDRVRKSRRNGEG